MNLLRTNQMQQAPGSESNLPKISRLQDYKALMKFTLSITVVFSSVISYLMAPNVHFTIKEVLLLTLGGLMVTGAANAINQIMEKDTDALMKRTANRPLPAGRISLNEAWVFSIICVFGGLFIMWNFFNLQAALISAVSLFTYSFIYTPLKKVSAISVLVGAFPGAFPCLIGWAAAYQEGQAFSWAGGWILFAIQFFWQFPHFWAIAWVAHADYTKAGFKLLPNQNEPTRNTALQAIGYAIIMIPIGFMPYFFQISGSISLIVILAANLGMIWQCFRLYKEMTVKAARRVMFSSYIYLPIVLIALYADKFRP